MKTEPSCHVMSAAVFGDVIDDPQVPVVPDTQPQREHGDNANATVVSPVGGAAGAALRVNKPQRLGQLPSRVLATQSQHHHSGSSHEVSKSLLSVPEQISQQKNVSEQRAPARASEGPQAQQHGPAAVMAPSGVSTAPPKPTDSITRVQQHESPSKAPITSSTVQPRRTIAPQGTSTATATHTQSAAQHPQKKAPSHNLQQMLKRAPQTGPAAAKRSAAAAPNKLILQEHKQPARETPQPLPPAVPQRPSIATNLLLAVQHHINANNAASKATSPKVQQRDAGKVSHDDDVEVLPKHAPGDTMVKKPPRARSERGVKVTSNAQGAKERDTERMVMMARCCICKGIFPVDDFPGPGHAPGDGIEHMLLPGTESRKCAPCQRLLHGIRNVSWGTESRVHEMLRKGMLKQYVRTLLWECDEPITTRYNPHYQHKFPGAPGGCCMLPLSCKSPDTGEFSAAVDSAEGLAPTQPHTPDTAVASAAKRASPAKTAAPAAAKRACPAPAAASAPAPAGAKAATVASPAAAKAVQVNGGGHTMSEQAAETAAAITLHMNTLSPADRAAAVASLSEALYTASAHLSPHSPSTTTPPVVPVNGAVKRAAHEDSSRSQQKRQRDMSQPEASTAPAANTTHGAHASAPAIVSGTATVDIAAGSKHVRSTGNHPNNAASTQNGASVRGHHMPIGKKMLQPALQPTINVSTAQLVHEYVPRDWLTRNISQLGTLQPQPIVSVQQHAVQAQQSQHVSGGAASTAMHASKDVRPKVEAVSESRQELGTRDNGEAACVGHAGIDGEAGGGTATEAEAGTHDTAQHNASNTCIASPQKPHALGKSETTQRAGHAQNASSNAVAANSRHADGHNKLASRSGTAVQIHGVSACGRQNGAANEKAPRVPRESKVNVNGLTTAILEGHLASVKLCMAARQKALGNEGLTAAEQQFAALAEEHLRRLNALLENVI